MIASILTSIFNSGTLVNIFVGMGGIALLAVGLKKLWLVLLPRDKTIDAGFKTGKKLAKKLKDYDIPVIAGQLEDEVKTRIITTSGDYSFGLFCGLNNLDVKLTKARLELKPNPIP